MTPCSPDKKLTRILEEPAAVLVYIDESGIDNTEDYAYGYCRKGERFHALKSGVKSQRISMISVK
jgi:hypothetical protein